jgi:hypothetical protein
MEENQDTGLKSFETEPQKNSSTPRGKSPRNRLLDRVKQLDSLSRNKELKLAKLADVQLEIASLERLLYNDSREDRNSETLTELATATEQLTRANAEIARLTQANVELRASQPPRVNAQVLSERIPDSALQQITTLEELLKAVSTLARGVDVDARTRHAVSLVIKHGKRAMSVVEGLGVDFSACASSLQKPESELLGLLSAAQQEGTGTPIWRAVLAVKYEIQVDGHGKRQSPYRDEFDSESSLYADSL